MEMDRVEFKIHREMRIALLKIARDQDVTPGQILRKVLAKEITRHTHARPPVRADEQLIAPLRARLANDLAHATCWADLKTRLNRKGFELREAGGGLALHVLPGGERVCKASELGFSYGRLMRRFRQPYPGHAHSWLADRFLSETDSEEDIELIENYP